VFFTERASLATIQKWAVQLGRSHAPYPQILLQRTLPDNSRYAVVVVDVAKFMACVRNGNQLRIPEIQLWSEEKREGLCSHLDPSGVGVPVMPRASIEEVQVKRWFGLRTPSIYAVVSFTNGRHRSAYMEFAGATQMPVEVLTDQVDLFVMHCT
jgi:hypothetical protein